MTRLIFISALILLPPLYFQSAAAAEEQELTTLRRIGQPKGNFVNGAGVLSIEYVEATYQNVGEVTATGIRVTATLPNGKTIDLMGPDTLERKKKAVYSNKGFEVVKSGRKIRTSSSCDNCR